MPPITVFCPFTRPEYVKRWFDDLASTDLDPANTNLAFIIDIGEDDFGQHLGAKIYSRILDEMNRTNYRKYIIARNYEHKVMGSITMRRKRIAEVHNQSKQMIIALDGQYVLGLEDDTVFTNLCVERLFRPFKNDNVGLVSAYEAGRWNMKMIGIWGFDDVKNPKECWTELPGKDYAEIDAAGFYCYLTPTTLYLQHQYDTEVADPYGPDVRYGLDLRQQGFHNYVDWSQPCGHIDGDVIITPNSDLFVERFTYDEKLKGWLRHKQ
jgi:hypothetical protein